MSLIGSWLLIVTIILLAELYQGIIPSKIVEIFFLKLVV